MQQYIKRFDRTESREVCVQEFRKGSWDDRLAKTMEFVNTKLQNGAQLIDIGLTMSNTDFLACIHIYYYKDTQALKKYNGKTFTNKPKLLVEWDRFKCSWKDASVRALDVVKKHKMNQTFFGVRHACGNHAHKHGGAVIFVFYWSEVPKLGEIKETVNQTEEGGSKQTCG